MIRSMIRRNRDYFSTKRFSKLDFLAIVLVAIIANSHFTSPYDLCISSAFPLLVSHTYFLKNCSFYPILSKFIFSRSKKKGLDRERERIMCSNLKIYVIKFDSFCLLLEYFDFFWMICSCLPFLIWFFAKTQNFHFLDHPPIKREKTNPYGNFSKQTNLKDSSVFQEVKIFGWFTILVIHFKIHF